MKQWPSYLILFGIFLYGFQVPSISLLALFLVAPLVLFLKRKRVDTGFILDGSLVFLFAFLYHMISLYHDLNDDVSGDENKLFFLIINFLLAYFLGYILAQNYQNIDSTLIVLGSGVILLAGLSVFQYVSNHGISLGGDSFIEDRAVPSFWNGSRINGPILGVYLSLGICLISLQFARKSIGVRIATLIIIGGTVYANLLLQNRSPIYAGLLVLSVSFFLFLFGKRMNRKVMIWLFMTPVFLYMGIHFYTGEWLDQLLSNPLLERFKEEGLDTPRYELWLKGLVGLFQYPFGGARTDFSPFDYAHNLWLDIGWYVGIVPTLILLWIQLRHVKYLFRLALYHTNVSFGAVGISLSFLVGMMGEPILIASQTYIALFFFFIGYVKSFVQLKEEKGAKYGEDSSLEV